MEYIDYLETYMTGRVKRFVENMGDNTPNELKDLRKENLIKTITEFAVPILRGMEDDAIQSACYRLTTGIRWAKQNEGARTHKSEKSNA